MNCELPDVQAGFRKGRRTRDQIANIRWIIKRAREFQKNTYFCFIDYVKAFDCVDHNKLWKILKDNAVKVLHSICQQTRKLSSGHRTEKVSCHSNPKEMQCQRMHSFHTLVK